MNTQSKIRTFQELKTHVRVMKARGNRIVMISGSFDIVHAGHIAALEHARSLGDTLIVLINSDTSIQLYKGKNRPINSETERASVIAAMQSVDSVHIFSALTPVSVLQSIHPDIYVTGSDWGIHCVERNVVEKNNGIIFILPKGTTSTTDIIARAKVFPEESISDYAVILDRDGTIIVDTGYPDDVEKITYTAGAIEALSAIHALGFQLFIASNQSGIGRGMFSQKTVTNINNKIVQDLADAGIHIKGVYVCPHTPDDDCVCRKPNNGMITAIAQEYNVILGKSWFIGDSCTDVAAGKLSNMKTIQVTEHSSCTEQIPHFIASNLEEAASIITRELYK